MPMSLLLAEWAAQAGQWRSGGGRGPRPARQPHPADGEDADGDPENVDGDRGHGPVVEGVDQDERAADEVEHLVGHTVAGQPARGDEALGQQQGGRADPAAEFDEEFDWHESVPYSTHNS